MKRHSKTLPQALFCSEKIKQGEQKIATDKKIALSELMQRAGDASFDLLRRCWPKAKKILICCGSGNNGGDGYVIARLAIFAGFEITLWQIAPVSDKACEAKKAHAAFIQAGGKIDTEFIDKNYDLIVDALLGMGCKDPLNSAYLKVVQKINALTSPVFAIDLPSGINPDTGFALNDAVKADVTLSFIGLKIGLFTADAIEHCGNIYFASLGIQEDLEKHISFDATLLQLNQIDSNFLTRNQNAHKSTMGKVLCIGGQKGMGGAVILAGQAALRAGAGLVTLFCASANYSAALACQAELMLETWNKKPSTKKMQQRIQAAKVVAIGPGLGRQQCSESLFDLTLSVAIAQQKNLLLDADALYWLAKKTKFYPHWILTPHMQEAARLLQCDLALLEQNRFTCAQKLQQRFGGVVVLKGAGTIVYDGNEFVVIHAGNPGMATAGMGDVLTGVIAAFLAQGLSLFEAAKYGAFLHSFTADCAAINGQRGLVASDLLPLLGKELGYLVSHFVK